MKVPADWYKSFFKGPFYNPACGAALEKAPEETRFILKRLNLKKGAALLDLCCGPGRHAVEFARRGLRVTGYDISTEYLREARRRAEANRVPLRLVRGDMRRLKFKGEFDAAVSLFTSFGYFLSPSDDIKTLEGAARALKPGGLFLIDVVHGTYVRKNFQPRSWRKTGGAFLLEETELTADGIRSAWLKIPGNGGKAVRRSFFSRLYDKGRLAAALKKAGLEPLRFWGDFTGTALSAGTDRLICLARRN